MLPRGVKAAELCTALVLGIRAVVDVEIGVCQAVVGGRDPALLKLVYQLPFAIVPPKRLMCEAIQKAHSACNSKRGLHPLTPAPFVKHKYQAKPRRRPGELAIYFPFKSAQDLK